MKKLYTLFSLLIFSVAFVGCNKKGCSDPTADNYVKNVKKACDNKCQYNGEGICGVNVQFCFELNGVKRTNGTIDFFEGGPGEMVKKITWTNGQTFGSIGYEDVVIEIYGNKESNSYSLSNFGGNNTFRAFYYSGVNNLEVAATSGNLSIKKDNTSDGLIATFNFTTENGIEIKKGNIYKLK